MKCPYCNNSMRSETCHGCGFRQEPLSEDDVRDTVMRFYGDTAEELYFDRMRLDNDRFGDRLVLFMIIMVGLSGSVALADWLGIIPQ